MWPRPWWPRLTLLLCRIKSLRIPPFVLSLRAVDMRVSSKLLTRLDPQSFGFLLFHVLFELYFCPAHAREVPHFACSPAKLCLKKYRSYSPSNGSKPYIILCYTLYSPICPPHKFINFQKWNIKISFLLISSYSWTRGDSALYASWLMCHVCECHDHANAILDVLPKKREPSRECRAAWTST